MSVVDHTSPRAKELASFHPSPDFSPCLLASSKEIEGIRSSVPVISSLWFTDYPPGPIFLGFVPGLKARLCLIEAFTDLPEDSGITITLNFGTIMTPEGFSVSLTLSIRGDKVSATTLPLPPGPIYATISLEVEEKRSAKHPGGSASKGKRGTAPTTLPSQITRGEIIMLNSPDFPRVSLCGDLWFHGIDLRTSPGPHYVGRSGPLTDSSDRLLISVGNSFRDGKPVDTIINLSGHMGGLSEFERRQEVYLHPDEDIYATASFPRGLPDDPPTVRVFSAEKVIYTNGKAPCETPRSPE